MLYLYLSIVRLYGLPYHCAILVVWNLFKKTIHAQVAGDTGVNGPTVCIVQRQASYPQDLLS